MSCIVKINTFGLLTFNFHVLHSSSTNLWMYITPLSPPPLSGVLELLMLTHLCVFFSRGRPAGASRSRGWKYVLGDVHGDQSGRDKVRPEFSFGHLSVCQSPSILSSISPDAPSSVLAVPFLANYSPYQRYFRYSCEYLVSRTFKSQDVVVFPEAVKLLV